MQQISVEGGAVSFQVEGSGPSIVLLHSGGSSHRQWRKVAAALDGKYTLVMPDFWGFGETDHWSGATALSHDDQAALVAAVIDHLQLSSTIIVGHSYGGASALRVALSKANVMRGMMLIEPIVMPLLKESDNIELYVEYTDMVSTFLSLAENDNVDEAWRVFLDYRNGEGTWSNMPEKNRVRFRNDTASNIEGFHANLNNPTKLADLRGIGLASEVLCGEKTTLPDRRVAELVAQTLPNSQLREIPEAGHMSPLSHPEAVAEAIHEFARREI